MSTVGKNGKGKYMHEASLVQGLLDMILNAVEKHNKARPEERAVRVQEIVCELGLIACVEARTLTACFELFAEGTLAEGATLTLNTTPLACRCESCGHAFSLAQRRFVCPACGSENIHSSGGHGLTLQSLRVESEGTDHD